MILVDNHMSFCMGSTVYHYLCSTLNIWCYLSQQLIVYTDLNKLCIVLTKKTEIFILNGLKVKIWILIKIVVLHARFCFGQLNQTSEYFLNIYLILISLVQTTVLFIIKIHFVNGRFFHPGSANWPTYL